MLARSREISTTAGATVLGWVLYDLAIVAKSPEPFFVCKLLPPSAIAVALGAITGALLGLHRRLFALAVLVAAGVSALQMFHPAQGGTIRIELPRVMLLLLLGTAAAVWSARRWHLPPVATGLLMGAGAALVFPLLQGQGRLLSWFVLAVAAVGLAGTRVSGRGIRRFAIAMAAVVPMLCVVGAAYLNTRLLRPDQPLPSKAAGPGRANLLLIVLDTVRADHLAPYGYERITTPGLDAFARERATRYTEARSASSWTLPSHASLFTGLYPSEHGAHHIRIAGDGLMADIRAQPLRDDVTTLAERLTARGYQTAAIVGNSIMLAHEFGLDRGFSHYDDRPGLRLGSNLLLQVAGLLPEVGHSINRNAETITDLALGWLAARAPERPFFLFLNYTDAHVPYIPPRPYDAAFSDEKALDPYAPEETLLPLLYDRKILYMDEHVTRVLHNLEEGKLLDNTVVIITSDHGEAFGEHGFWQHDKTLYEEVLHVPLYVKSVGQRHSAVSNERMTGPQVFYLALRDLGFEAVEPRDNEVIAEWHQFSEPAELATDGSVARFGDLIAWMEGHVKWIVDSMGPVEAYDLDTDPRELRNLAVDRDQVERARVHAAHWWNANPVMLTALRQPQEPNAETRERMRTLGY